MSSDAQRARIAALAALQDPADRALFDLAAGAVEAIGRDEAAEALGLPRATAAFRLDRLVDRGLLAVEYRRRTGRSGPGAGRPAKLYRLVVDEVAASVPERHYDLAAEILSAAVEQAVDDAVPVGEAVVAVATARGTAIGRQAASLDAALEDGGYSPEADGDEVRLTSCPFHRLARRHTATICGINHALLRGVLAGTGGDPDRAALVPDPAGCCVRIAAAPS
jgi:predicted ArsR family transcriptional regulator